MFKKRLKMTAVLSAALMMSVIAAVPAFAAGWQKNNTGWWYGTNADNSTWYANGWQWVDGNGDGVAKCYYFDGNGYIATNGTTPDGYQVNADGQWMQNGVVQTKSTTTTANTSRPSSKEIVDYLYRGLSLSDSFTKEDRYNLCIDYSRPEWQNGVTNIKPNVGSRWSRTHGGWYFIRYDNVDVEAIALNDEGYLLADTTTPDGYYVNKHGVLEIGGREVAHSEECLYVATSINVPDKNHVDPNQYRYQDIGIGHSWGMTSYSFGNLVYNHFHGYDKEKGGLDSRIDSWNDFGVCVLFK